MIAYRVLLMKPKYPVLLIIAVIAGAAGVILGIIAISLAYQPSGPAESPSVTDWMQGIGNIAGVVVGIGAALAAGAVYWQGQQALAAAEEQRLADNHAAAEAARVAKERWEADREAAEKSFAATQRHMQAQIENARDAATTAEAQLSEDRRRWQSEQQETRLEYARSVIVTRVGPGMTGRGQLGEMLVVLHNFGAQPIRRVVVTVGLLQENVQLELKVPAVGPGQQYDFRENYRDSPISVSMGELPAWDVDVDSDIYSVSVTFIDAAGRRWERQNNEEPEWLNRPHTGSKYARPWSGQR
ncbi:hypothetical protein FB565_000364 [Actinoplanes lutulentus]|uniref:Uncharacterized protein n=1 Tax=Actinoplanes lutulentus TaxID=1287878 RepID=A0A327ZL18_9ACTN|nr:hypothetical protein [Actinoplanes lutulentus]MBB2940660.1 hypothetical protein [Actinoplanes lutulentus]RAK42971.1 hypothetical protein B0I29_101101 [Actinoplanes lutulentus]